MEKEKTRLEQIIEQKANEIAQAIEEEISNGISVEKTTYGLWINGVVNILNPNGYPDSDAVMILKLKSNKIKEIIADDINTLQEKKKTLQKQMDEIEKQISERTKK